MFHDYYKILGLKRTASIQEIKAAYRRLAHKYHPDKSIEPEAHEKFALINEAYSTLSNPESKDKYDAEYLMSYALFLGFKPSDLQTNSPESNAKRRKRKYRVVNVKRKKNEYSPFHIKLAKGFNIFCFVFTCLLFIDYFLPEQIIEQNALLVPNFDFISHGNNSTILIKTQSFTFPYNYDLLPRNVYKNETIHIGVTPLFRIKKTLSIDFQKPSKATVSPHYGIYSVFIFFPLFLLLTSMAGSIIRKDKSAIVSFSMASGILIVIVLAMM
jgi:hypothetical protein